jgi:hypothetical protein
MNPKIKALEQQCWSHRVDGVLVDGHLHFDAVKFAELIVQDLIHSMIKRYGDDDELPIQEIKLFVKEHFGVKE